MTCRFGENRRNLHRPVQKLLTARLPTAFKPAAAMTAFFRFPTSPTGSTTIMIFVLSFLPEIRLDDKYVIERGVIIILTSLLVTRCYAMKNMIK